MAQVDAVGGGEPIAIRVKDQAGEETLFRIRRSTKMKIIFKAYAQQKNLELEYDKKALRFTIDGERINPEATPIDLGLQDEDVIDVILAQVGMISTFTASDTSDALIQYLMLTDEERVTAPVPIQQLKEKQRYYHLSADSDEERFTYKQNPDILDPSQLNILSDLLSFVWDKTSTIGNSDRVDMRLTLSDDQFIAVSIVLRLCGVCMLLHCIVYRLIMSSSPLTNQILASLDASLGDKYKSTSLNDKFKELFDQVPGARTHWGHKIALRMTKGPTNSCINFHCDGGYASSTSQIPLNETSEYDGGTICFFMKDDLYMVSRVPGSLVQHPPNVLHGVTSVTRGIRKSLFIVDKSNGLGEGGVIKLTSDHVNTFLAQRDGEKRQRGVEQEGSLAKRSKPE